MEKLDIALLTNMSILLVEDDRGIRKSIAESLRLLFDKVYTEADGLAGFKCYQSYSPDIILTDISMPHEDGLNLIEKVRESDLLTSIIIISAYSNESYLHKASNLQIDGYIIKPVNLEKLLNAFSRAIKRIKINRVPNPIVRFYGDYKFNLQLMELSYNDKMIPLGKKETIFIQLLCNNIGKPVSKYDISKTVWKNQFMSESALKNLIAGCRKKIEKNAIINQPGIGWRLNHSKPDKK